MNRRIVILLVTIAVLAIASVPAGARAAPASLLPSHNNLAWFLIAFELGPWEEYLVHELTPDFEQLGQRPAPRVSWVGLDESLILPDFAAALIRPESQRPTLRLVRRDLNIDLAGTSRSDLGRLERSLLMPGISAQMRGGGAVTVSAVLATQHFVAAGMNLSQTSDEHTAWLPTSSYWQRHDISHGAGLRFALAGELLDGLIVEAAFQSRIDMNEFASLRGVHGSRAELDIPPRIQMGMQVQTGQNSAFNLGLSQIFYSEVGAFPSRALPARFNALLGDSTSPQFGWEDLLVYSIGWSWRPMTDLEFNVDYRTRSQPRPSSPLLASALAPELAQNAVLVGLNKSLSSRSRVALNAAYAPPEFVFGGNVLGVVSDRLDQSLEVQATWSFDF